MVLDFTVIYSNGLMGTYGDLVGFYSNVLGDHDDLMG